MKQKTLTFFLALAMLFSLVACGIEEPETSNIPETETTSNGDTSSPVATDGYQLLYEYNGAKIFYNAAPVMNEKGDLKLDIKIDTSECAEGIAVELSDCTVNGFGVSCPSQVSTPAGGEIEMTLGIQTSAMAQYGLKNYADIKTGFTIYSFNDETYQANEPALTVIPPVSLVSGQTVSDTEVSGLTDPIFDKDGITVYSIQSEDEFCSLLNLYVINKTGKAISLVPTELEMNGEKQDTDYSDYAIAVSADSATFASLPLPNYTVDTETWATQKFDVTDYSLNFIIQ